jgi:hypothetical protein
MSSLINREFVGVVLSNIDSSNRGSYKVNIPELQPHMPTSTGIWCKNHTCRHRISPSNVGICGSYYPLQAGMLVIVKFFANHIESGYIDRVISDAYPQSLPFEATERDDYYQIIRTPKHNNLIAIFEGSENSKNIPKNSIHIYFNDLRTTLVIDESGVNIKTDDNINTTISGNCKITVNGNTDIKTGGTTSIESSSNIEIKSASSVNVEGSSQINVKSSGMVKIDGSKVKINCKTASSAASATPAAAPTLITNSDYDFFKKNTGK